jgi:hypothetical protein
MHKSLHNIYIVDFITAVKICESKLYRMYLDPTYSFLGEEFLQSLSLVADIPTFVEQDQSFDFNFRESHLVYKADGISHMVGMCFIVFLNELEDVLCINREVSVGLVKNHLFDVACRLTN